MMPQPSLRMTSSWPGHLNDVRPSPQRMRASRDRRWLLIGAVVCFVEIIGAVALVGATH